MIIISYFCHHKTVILKPANKIQTLEIIFPKVVKNREGRFQLLLNNTSNGFLLYKN